MANIKLRSIVANDDGTGNVKKRTLTLSNINEACESNVLKSAAANLAGLIEGDLDSTIKVTEEEL